jgi:hypothetical protein
MKLNQELIKRLAAGEIQLQNTGTVEQLNEILKAAFPEDVIADEIKIFYEGFGNYCYSDDQPSKAPVFTTKQFFDAEAVQERGERILAEINALEHVPDVRKVMDAETRELAKQLFIHNDNLTQAECIEFAIDFIQILNKHE